MSLLSKKGRSCTAGTPRRAAGLGRPATRDSGCRDTQRRASRARPAPLPCPCDDARRRSGVVFTPTNLIYNLIAIPGALLRFPSSRYVAIGPFPFTSIVPRRRSS